MKIFVTGVNGQLGYDVMCELNRWGIPAVGSDIADRPTPKLGGSEYKKLDITDGESVMSVIKAVDPDAIIHCAAYTAVDAAEEEENRETVEAVNVRGTCNLAAAARDIGAKLLYISTDYVFDGRGSEPWRPDQTSNGALNVYGQSKLDGECAVAELESFFIVRIAWAFGLNGNNFIKTMLSVGKKYPNLRVVNDQIGTPTYTRDLARLLVDMILTEKYGYYHATNEGEYISWYDFALEIFRRAGYTNTVTPVSTEEYGLSRAERPRNSRLDRSKLSECGFEPLPTWQDALERYLKELKKNGTD